MATRLYDVEVRAASLTLAVDDQPSGALIEGRTMRETQRRINTQRM